MVVRRTIEFTPEHTSVVHDFKHSFYPSVCICFTDQDRKKTWTGKLYYFHACRADGSLNPRTDPCLQADTWISNERQSFDRRVIFPPILLTRTASANSQASAGPARDGEEPLELRGHCARKFARFMDVERLDGTFAICAFTKPSPFKNTNKDF